MDYTTVIAAAIGVLMPVIITIVKQAGLNRWLNLLITVGACAIAGFLTVLARGELTAANVGTAIVAVFVAAEAVYAAFWKDAGIESVLNNLTSLIK